LLEAAIDKALASAFGYGTSAYLRYTQAATLAPSPLLAEATGRANGLRPGGAPALQDAKVQETREHFAENRSRAMTLLRQAIRTLEEEIAAARSGVEKTELLQEAPMVATPAPAKATSTAKIEASPPAPRSWAGISLEGARHRMAKALMHSAVRSSLSEARRQGGLCPIPDSRPEKMMQRSGCDLWGMSNTIQ
jgi:hypothetical protein